MLERYDPKLAVLRFMAVFMSYCPQFYGPRAFNSNLQTRYMFESYDQKLVVFLFCGHFHELLPRVFGFQEDWHASLEPIHVWEIWPKTRRFRILWPFSWAISHSFMVLGWFTTTLRRDACLRVMTKNSFISCFMVIFMCYCPQFLGSRRICMPRKNSYMFEIYDQKLIVFVFYGRFHELLPLV